MSCCSVMRCALHPFFSSYNAAKHQARGVDEGRQLSSVTHLSCAAFAGACVWSSHNVLKIAVCACVHNDTPHAVFIIQVLQRCV